MYLRKCFFLWQAPRYTPVRALVDAVPQKGAPRYDFLRQLLRGMTSPNAAAAKYDPVWDLLHAAKERGLPGLLPPCSFYVRYSDQENKWTYGSKKFFYDCLCCACFYVGCLVRVDVS